MILCIVMLLLNRKGSAYESELIKITDKISTPVAAGQKQHGSAKWMSRKEFDKHFNYHELIGCKSLTKAGTVIGMYKNKIINKSKEKIYYIGDDIHTLCIGSTRSGKSRNVVLQSIGLMGLAGESMIISDRSSSPSLYFHPAKRSSLFASSTSLSYVNSLPVYKNEVGGTGVSTRIA